MARATPEDLERLLENEMMPGGRCTVAQGLMQVCMHKVWYAKTPSGVKRRPYQGE